MSYNPLADEYEQYSQNNAASSPKENLAFNDLLSGVAISRGTTVPRIGHLYRSNSPLGTQQFERPGIGFDVKGFSLSHNIIFESASNSVQERLRKQQIFELNSFLSVVVNKVELIKIELAKIVPYFFANSGGDITVHAKQQDTMYYLPQTLFIGSGIPVEFKLELHQEFKTDGTIVGPISSQSEFGVTRVPDPANPGQFIDIPNFFMALTTEAIERTQKVG